MLKTGDSAPNWWGRALKTAVFTSCAWKWVLWKSLIACRWSRRVVSPPSPLHPVYSWQINMFFMTNCTSCFGRVLGARLAMSPRSLRSPPWILGCAGSKKLAFLQAKPAAQLFNGAESLLRTLTITMTAATKSSVSWKHKKNHTAHCY